MGSVVRSFDRIRTYLEIRKMRNARKCITHVLFMYEEVRENPAISCTMQMSTNYVSSGVATYVTHTVYMCYEVLTDA